MKQRFKSAALLQATVSTVIGASLLGFAANAEAGSDSTPGVNTEWERCYGVSKAGENDCSSLNGSHGCSGASLVDNDPNEYIWLPKGACARIVNGVSYEVKKSRNIKKWCEKKVKKLDSARARRAQ